MNNREKRWRRATIYRPTTVESNFVYLRARSASVHGLSRESTRAPRKPAQNNPRAKRALASITTNHQTLIKALFSRDELKARTHAPQTCGAIDASMTLCHEKYFGEMTRMM